MSALQKQDDCKIIREMIFDKFGKITLSAEETASILGVKVASLKKDREESTGIPYTRRNNKPSGTPLYSITAIAKTIVDNEIKIFS